MTEKTTDMEAWALLEEHRQRVAMVETLTSQPVWSRVLGTLLVPIATAALFMMLVSVSASPGGDLLAALLASALVGVAVLAVALAETTRRLMTLVSILRRSGVLADFADAARPAGDGPAGR
jgi:hypothetical protein